MGRVSGSKGREVERGEEGTFAASVVRMNKMPKVEQTEIITTQIYMQQACLLVKYAQ